MLAASTLHPETDPHQQHPLRSAFCPATATTSDSDRTRTYALHRFFPHKLLSARGDPLDVAIAPSISPLHPFFQCRIVWNAFPSLEPPALFLGLVTVRFLLPSAPPPLLPVDPDEEICFWISSTWDHLSWCICRLRYGSFGLQSAIPWHYEYVAHAGLQFPDPILSRLCSCDGSRVSVS